MAIPFFSIDMSKKEWSSFLGGLVNHWGWFGRPSSNLAVNLEQRFPDHQVLLLSSARLGYYLLLKSSFRPGDEIIFSAMSFPLYVKIAIQIGLRPVFVDVDPEHLNINPENLRQAITDKTRAIVVTHLFGHPAEINEVMSIANEYGIRVIEDCAQAFDSFYGEQEAGTFGWTGIYSCSLMKVPTTLGGGILLTKDIETAVKIKSLLGGLKSSTGFSASLSYHLKGMISILNSYPLLYTLLSHQVFGLIKKRNPELLRAILYSGMGMNKEKYDPGERPDLAPYQHEVGAVQFARAREMTEARRRNSTILDEALSSHKDVTVLKESTGVYWNYQYHVINLGASMNRVFDTMFARGIHVMKEDVWDCTAHKFPQAENIYCEVASTRNSGLLRIPNNSVMSEKKMIRIASTLLEALG
mgnify:CR=1 FL=1